jgi:hypothetical protein
METTPRYARKTLTLSLSRGERGIEKRRAIFAAIAAHINKKPPSEGGFLISQFAS